MIETSQLYVKYRGKVALQEISLSFDSRFTAIIGPSGAGKSTLMRAMNGLVPISSGQVLIDGQPLGKRGSIQLRQQQCQMGMVFQQFNLVRRLSALDNVLLGRMSQTNPFLGAFGFASKDDRALALHLLERVGLADHAWQRADQLSGGQQQRVGIARALAQQPKVILADEPISALDPRSSHEVMEILRTIQEQDGIAVIANLHFLDTVRQYAQRVIGLQNGKLVFDGPVSDLDEKRIRQLYHQPETNHESESAPQSSPKFVSA